MWGDYQGGWGNQQRSEGSGGKRGKGKNQYQNAGWGGGSKGEMGREEKNEERIEEKGYMNYGERKGGEYGMEGARQGWRQEREYVIGREPWESRVDKKGAGKGNNEQWYEEEMGQGWEQMGGKGGGQRLQYYKKGYGGEVWPEYEEESRIRDKEKIRHLEFMLGEQLMSKGDQIKIGQSRQTKGKQYEKSVKWEGKGG